MLRDMFLLFVRKVLGWREISDNDQTLEAGKFHFQSDVMIGKMLIDGRLNFEEANALKNAINREKAHAQGL